MNPHVATAAFIANTDFGWFSLFLHRAEPPVEVDLWQPSPHGFRAIPPGAPFFSRLGAPTGPSRATASCRATSACPCGSPGSSGFAEMTARIEAIRHRTGSALLSAALIPCFLHGLCYLHMRCE